MSGWRVMNSILVLRDQVDEIAPNRATGADGTICDGLHDTSSDHCPHYVEGVGNDMVTALDLTHDPAGAFDSFLFAEVLRINKDKRIKYVISNNRIFSSYQSSSRAPWTWGPYSGSDPHTNHVHISVLDDPISDTSNPWNLEGFDMSEADVRTGIASMADEGANRSTPTGRNYADDFNVMVSNALDGEFKAVQDRLTQLETKLDQVLAQLAQGSGGGSITFPATSNYTATTSGTIIWNTPGQ